MVAQGSDDIMALIWATSTDTPSYDVDNNYSWWLWDFNVFDTISEEKEYANRVSRDNLVKHLKNRSSLRKAIRSWEKTTWNKERDTQVVNSSELVDWLTDVLIWLWKSPEEVSKYQTSTGNMEAINKLKQLQWWKFSWDIQNFIDWKSAMDATWMLSQIFPEYMANKWYWLASPEEMASVQKDEWWISWDTRNWLERAWEDIINFKWSDIWLESEARPIKWVWNFIWWAVNDIQKIIPWAMDIINQVTMTSPEKFSQQLDEWYYIQNWVKRNAKEIYNSAVKNQWYKWSYNQWVEDAKNSYSNLYNQSTSQAEQVSKNRWDFWFNTVDEESQWFQLWELSTEVWQQLLLDKRLASALNKWVDLYKWYKAVKGGKDIAKWTELATRWTELALEWTEGLAKPQTMQESKNIANRIIDWYNKWGKLQDFVKAWAEWWKSWLEYQLIWDVQEWQLSDAQAYWMSAGFGTILWTIFNVIGKWWQAAAEPSEWLRTSLKRLWVQDVDEVLNWSEAAAKDHTLPSAKQRVTDDVIAEAKKNVKDKLDAAWQDLWNFRKTLWQSDLTVADFNKTINKWLTNKWVWAKIVEKDGKYAIEWYPWEYGDVLNKIVDRMNSAVENVKNKYELYKAWEEVDFWTNTTLFEDLIADLKSFSMKEPDAEVRQKFIEIENDLLDNLKWSMSDAQWETYKWYLDKYSKLKTKYKKVWELEWVMNKWWIAEQPKMSDNQYLSDFLEELYSDKSISKNAKDRRIIALFADAIYWVPLKPWEKVPYPTKYWWLEEAQRRITKLVNLPKNKITWWWRSYAWDYKPSATRSALKKWAKQAKTTAIWKMAEQPREE